MRCRYFIILTFLGFTLLTGVRLAQAGPEEIYVDFKSPEGIRRLETAKLKVPFFYLANQFEPQQLKPFGGPAAATIVMNTLRFEDSNGSQTMPLDEHMLTKDELSNLGKEAHPFFNRFTQRNVFVEGVKAMPTVLGRPLHTDKGDVDDTGFQLRQLHELFLANHFKSEIHVADDSWTLSSIRDLLKKQLKDPKKLIVANYSRSKMGQPQKNGHISPVAAYDQRSDSFLILDVNPNISHWGWVKAKNFLEAMKTRDTLENRGYLIVSEDVH